MEERHHTKVVYEEKSGAEEGSKFKSQSGNGTNDSKEADGADIKEDDEVEEEQEENGEEDPEEVEEEHMQVDEKMEGSPSAVILTKSPSSDKDIKWDGELVGKMCSNSAQLPPIYFVEYMFENSDARKMVHGRLMLRGSQTVLAKASG
ncbi:hypothetical protein Pint_13858 [Pistacia integerrima]|uniref:Uncharacterized protein n=1 Tax=Pistacia integerrima TaxID=434235 RepID=A0ACC0YB79_9ROSI|nr:hypothetical protein Pint_13858 [Pistacia integerrima]